VAVAEIEETTDRRRLGTARDLIALINGASMSQVIGVAAELRIADLLATGPKGLDELAQASGTHAPSLRRLLRALVSLELCTERDDGSFALSETGAFLRTDVPDSLRSWIIWSCKYQWPVWGNLLHSVKSGESARNHATGTSGFGHLERDLQAAAVFNDAMVEQTRLIASELVRVYSFGEAHRIVDVGGGFGALLAAVLAAHPGLHGVLFDLPHAIEGARQHLANAGVARRCDFVSGDFFKSVPGGADVYLLKSVIHDWDDERSAVLLGNCRRAISGNGKILLIERIMPTRMERSPRHRALAWSDLAMLVGPGGRERTELDFRALLDASGFGITNVISTALDYCIIEGIPR
jgi:orsellinic acid C2-O-methyltransferase